MVPRLGGGPRGRHRRRQRLLEESLAVARAVGDRGAEAAAWWGLGKAAATAGDGGAARAAYTESLTVCRVLGGDWRAAYPLNSLGVLALAEGDAATARALLEERLPELRATGPRWLLGHVLVNLGTTALELGDPEGARADLAEGLQLFRELASLDGAAMGLAGLARLAAAQGQAERAGRLFGAAAVLCPAGGPAPRHHRLGRLRPARGRGPGKPRPRRVRGGLGSGAGPLHRSGPSPTRCRQRSDLGCTKSLSDAPATASRSTEPRRVSPTRSSPASVPPRSVPLPCREERWRRGSLERCLAHSHQEGQQCPALLAAGSYHRQ